MPVVQMLPYKILIPLDKNAATPVYRQIANGLVNLIRGGTIKPGDVLPPSRQMALQLHTHRKTIVTAYEELYTQDWIETIPRKGVTVSQRLPDVKPRTFKAQAKTPAYSVDTGFTLKKIAFFAPQQPSEHKHRLTINDGFPDARIAPVGLLMKEHERLFGNTIAEGLGMRGQMAGSLNLRTQLATFLSATRGLNISAANILTARGAQMAIYIAAALLIKPGAAVIVGEPGYFMANIIFEQFGAKLIRVPVDENGIDADAVEKLCRHKKPALLYIVPHHHHPTTVTLSAERRMKILQIVQIYNLPVIEDDYDYDFHYNSSPILPLASADHGGNVIYTGSLTKCLAPSVRMGYMVAPKNFIDAAAQLRMMMDIRGDYLLEEALAWLFTNGHLQRHLKKSLKLYHQRRDMLCGLLESELGGALSFTKPQGGMAVWARFNNKYALPAIARKASSLGLYMSDGKIYNSSTVDYNALRIGFACLNEREMTDTVEIIKHACR